MPEPNDGDKPKDNDVPEPKDGDKDGLDLSSLDAETLQSENPGLYQAIFKKGHSKARKSSQGEIEQLKTRLETMESYMDSDSGGDDGDASSQPGDSGFDKKKYEDALLKANQRIDKMLEEREDFEKKTLLGDVKRRADALLNNLGVNDSDIRDAILLPQLMERVEIGEQGEITALDADGLTPLQGGLESLAKSVFDSAKDEWKASTVSKGPDIGRNKSQESALVGGLEKTDGNEDMIQKAVEEGKKAAQNKQHLAEKLSFQ